MRAAAVTSAAVLAVLATLAAVTVVPGAPAVAGAAGVAELRVVTVLPSTDGATTVVADLRPAPTAALPAGAAEVAAGGERVPATTAPLFDPTGQTALVVDASAGGTQALPEVLSGATAFLLRLPETARVTVVADGAPPRSVTARPVARAPALGALVDLRAAAGGPSTIEALELALRDLPPPDAGHPLVLLQTTSAPPRDGEQARRLAERLRGAGAVLAVVAAPGLAAAWGQVATPTGGLAVEAAPGAVADAFDEVTRVLRGRLVVTFVAPSGAPSAELQVRAGGDVLTTDVPLAPGGQAAQAGSAPPAPGTSPPGDQRPALAVGVIALMLAAVAGFVLLVRPRRSPGTLPAGVRAFDVTDPASPVEIAHTAPPGREVPFPAASAADNGGRQVSLESGSAVEVGSRQASSQPVNGDLRPHGDAVPCLPREGGREEPATGSHTSSGAPYVGRHRRSRRTHPLRGSAASDTADDP